MVKNHCKERTPKMSNTEASLRARLLMKSAELDELSIKYNKLKEEFNCIKKIVESHDECTRDMKMEMNFCAGKLSAYQEIMERMFG